MKTRSTKIILILALVCFSTCGQLFGATYYSFIDGQANNESRWWSNPDGTGTHPANFTNPADIFIIQSGTNITTHPSFGWTVTGTVTINIGGTFTSMGNSDVTIGTLNIYGTYQGDSKGEKNITNLVVGPAGVYNHNCRSELILKGTNSTSWDPASNCNITYPFNNPTVLENFVGQTFGNFTYNSPGQASSVALVNEDGVTIIQGNFTIVSTGTGTLYMRNTNLPYTATININGDFIMSGGIFDIHDGGSAPSDETINLADDFTMTGGNITQTTTSAASRVMINFSKPGTQSFVKTGGTITSGTTVGPGIQFNVLPGSTLNMGTSILDGTNQTTFTLNPGAGIITANTGGLSTSGATGSIQVANTRTYSTSANYTYNGTTAQVTGNGLTGATNLTFNNLAGVTLSSNVTVSSTLTLTAGNVTTGTNSIYVSNSSPSAIIRTSGNITGQLQRAIAGSGDLSYNFPLGTATGYNPVDLEFVGLSAGGILSASVIPGSHPVDGSPINPAQKVNLYWSFTNSGVAFTSYTAIFTYNSSDIIGGASQDNFIMGMFEGAWTSPSPVYNEGSGPYYSLVSGLTSYSDFVIGAPPCSIVLSSAPGTDAQTVCVNSPIINITYATTGTNGATVTGLPAGVTGVYTTDLVTISGTPTTAVGSPFTYTVDLQGCGTLSATGTITVNPRPTPVISGPVTACANSAGHIYSTPSVAGHTYVWAISGGTITAGAGTNSITVTWNAAGAGWVQVTETITATGCSLTTAQYNVTINPLPTPVISGAVAACANSTGHVYSTPSVAGHTYVWTISGGTITAGAGTNSITVTWNAAGAGWVQVTETITATGCAVTTAQYNVTINPLPAPVITGPASVCANSTGNIYSTPLVSGHTYVWAISGGTITAGAGTNSITVTWNAAGAGWVQVTETITATGCVVTTAQYNVTINPLPTPVITGPVAACANSAGHVYSTPLVGGHTYAWAISGGTITGGAGTNSITVTWNAAGAGWVQVTETITATSCAVTTAQYNVTINPLPTPVITGPASVCANSTGNIYSTPSVAGHTYVWAISGGTITAGAGTNSITVTWNAAGAGWVEVTETITVTGCVVTTAQYNVTINPLPTPVITGPATVCANSTGNIYSTPSVAGHTYVWAISGGTITAGAGTNSITVTWNAAGAGWVQVTETITATGCVVTTAQYNVTINPLPTPVITGPASVCANSTGNIYSTPSVGGHTYVWAISGGTITGGAGTNSITVTWNAAGAGWVQVTETITATSCAVTTAQYNVTINPLPTPVITGPASVCANSTGNIYSTPSVAGHTYVWAISGGSITAGAGTNSITVTWNAAGAGWVQVTETITATGCVVTTAQYNVTINPLPTPVITGPAIVCANSTGNIYSTPSVAGHTYVWAISGGTITGGAGTNSITVTWNAAGAGWVQVTETITATSCAVTTAQYNVTINPLPTPVITGPASVCANSTGNVYSTPSVAGHTYVWAISGGTITGGAGTNSITVTWNAAGAGWVQVTETITATSCAVTTAQYNVTINPLPTPVITGPASVCANSTGNIYSTPSVAGHTYVWALSGGTITGGAGTNSITVTWNAAGAGWVQVTETITATSCAVTTAQYNVTINPLPTPVITGPASVCANSTGNIYSTPSVAGHTYVWAISGGTITGGAGTNSITVTWNAAGAGWVQVTETITATGCVVTTAQYNVTINPLPTPVISGPVAACANSTGHIYSTPSVAGHTYVWAISGGTITGGAGTNSITVTWNAAGAGWVQVTETITATGCVVTTAQYNVTINALPVPTISGSNVLCEGSSGYVYTTQAGMSNYLWTVSAGGTITAGGGTGNNTVTVTWNIAGAQTVSVNYTNGNGCTAPSPTVYNVTVNPRPVPSLTGPTNVCMGSTGNVYTTDPGQSNYTWFVSGGGTITGGGTATDNTVTVTWNTAGARSVGVNYSNSFGCFAFNPTSLPVTVNPLPVATATPSSQTTCSGDPITTIVLTSTVPFSDAATNGGFETGSFAPWVILSANPMPVVTNTASHTGTYSALIGSPGPYGFETPGDAIIYQTMTVPAAGGILSYWYQPNTTDGISWDWQDAYIMDNNGNWLTTIMHTCSNAGWTNVTYDMAAFAGQTIRVEFLVHGDNAGDPTNMFVDDVTLLTPTTFSWTRDNTVAVTGIPASGTGDISGSLTNTTPAPVNVTFTITPDAGGCVGAPITATVLVNPLPTPVITGPASVCANSTGNIYSTPSVAGHTYVWAISGGTITAGAGTNSITVTWNAAGAGWVQVTETITATGCVVTTAQYNVTINPLPTPVITGPAIVCANSTGNIYSTPSVAGHTYVWAISGGTITGGAGTNSITVTWNAAGAGWVQVTETITATSCAVTTAQYNVTINPLPTPVITGPASVCANSTGNVYSTPSVAGHTYVWAISGGTITGGAGTNSITVTWNAAGAGWVQVTETITATGCVVTTAQYNVTINPLPTPVITGPASVCANSTGNIYSTPSVAGHTYVWAISGGTITGGAGTNSITVTWNAAGAGWVQVTETITATGCVVTTAQYNVTINPLPTPVITGPASVCANSTGNVYSTPSVAGHTYVWAISGGTITGGAGTNSITVTWNAAGAGWVQVTETITATSCAVTTAQYNVTINPLPTPVITGPASVCANSTGNIYSTPSVAGHTYVWAISGGTITGGAGTNSITVTWNAAGAGWVQVTETITATGCVVTTAQYNVTINPLPVPTITGPTPVCQNSAGNVYITQAGMSGYSWTVSAGGSITAGTGTNSITVTWNTAGAQTVSVNYTDLNGCTAAVASTFPVTVNPPPVATATPSSQATCSGNAITTIVLTSTVPFSDAATNGGFETGSFAPWVILSASPMPVVTNASAHSGSYSAFIGSPGSFGSETPGDAIIYQTMTVPAAGGILSYWYQPNTTDGIFWDWQDAYIMDNNGNWLATIMHTCSSAGWTNVTYDMAAFAGQTIRVEFLVHGDNAGDPTNMFVDDVTLLTPTTFSWTRDNTVAVTGIPASGTGNISGSLTNTTPAPVNVTFTITPDAGGCVGAPITATVLVNPLPVPTITGNTLICGIPSTGNHYVTEALMTGYTWTVSAGGTITAGAGTNDITVTWNAFGPQTVSVNYTDANGCTALSPTVLNVSVNPVPVPTISGPGIVCNESAGNVYTTEAGMLGYSWTVTGGTITNGAGTNAITVTWNVAGIQTVSVDYTAPSGCSSLVPGSMLVIVIPLPTPTISGPNNVCEASTGNVYTTESGMTGYTWTVSAGGTITAGGTSTDNTVTVTWNTPGPQTVSVSYTNAFGCSAAAPTVYNITVNPRPVPVITGPASVCVNSTGNVYVTNSGNSNYIWVVSAGGTITAGGGISNNSVTVTWNTVGAQSVSVSYTDANGCTTVTPTVYNVTVNPLPVPTITGPASVCINSTGNVYTTQAGMSNYLWAVSAGGTITAGGGTGNNTVTVTWNTAGAQTVSVNYTNGNGCTAAAPTVYNVTVNPLPVPTITGPTPVCAGSTGNVYTTQAGMTGYLWTVSAGGTITAGSGTNAITVTWNTAGAQTVSVNYTNTNGCTAVLPTVFNVTVNALPVPTITGPTPVCAGTAGNVYTTEAGQSGYIWAVSAGGTITAGSGTNAITVTWNTAGAQTVSVNYTNANGCTAAAPTIFNVTVNPLPVPTITGPASVCVNSTGNVYTTEAGMTNYTWAVSAGGTITAGGGTGNNSVTITWNTVGAQTVSVNYTNANGCTAAAPTVYNVTVNPLPVPTITGPASVCVNSTGNVYTTQAGMSNYLWTVSAGGTITAGGGTGNNTVTVTWNTVGAQTVSVNYTNANGCTAVAPTVYNVTVNPLPVPTITGPASVCVNSTGNVYTTQAGMTGYLWTVSAGGTITAGSGTNAITVTWNTAGPQTVSVNYTNANGCTAVTPTVYNVTVNPLPVPTITGPASVCVNSTGNVYSTETGMTGYTWAVSAGGTITAGGGTSAITVTWNTAGAQTVSVNYTNANGCTAAAPTVYNVTVNPLPVPTITGPASVCVNSTGNVYSTETGMTGYLWTVSAGGTITAGAGTSAITVTWSTVGAKTVSVNYTNANGCTAASPTVYNVTVNPLPVPTITGPTPICVLSTGNVYTTEAGMTGYTWTVSAGGTITAGAGTNAITVTWNLSGAQTVSVNYTNANGCTAAVPTVFNVTVIPSVGVPVFVLGPTSTRCQGPNVVTYTANATNNTGITYTLDAASLAAGITINGATGAVTYTAGWVGVSMITATATGCNGPSIAFHLATTNPRPGPSISGPAVVCVTSCGNVYSTEPGMVGYTWTISAGGTITSGAGTSSITVCWNTAGAQNVSVNYTNGFGCPALVPTVYNVTVNALPVPTITGPAAVCENSTGNVYTTQTGMSGYTWAVSAGGTITGGAGTNAITVTWNTAGAQTVSVNYTNANGCTAAAPTVYNVTVSGVPVPTITGATSMCVNSGFYTYTTEAGMLNYVWTVSSGGVINFGSGTYQIQVSWIAGGAQTVSVTYSSPIGCGAAAPTVLDVTVTPLPDQAGSITGTPVVCAGQTGVAYSVAPINGAVTYVWTLPPNATIASGSGTNSITVDYGMNAISGNITVYGNNLCGNGGTSPLYAVTVNSLPDSAGTINGPAEVCEGSTGAVYTVPPIANATGYNWTVPAGATIMSGGNTNSIVVDFAMGASSGAITVAGTNSCGNGTVSPDFNVTVNPIPAPAVVTNIGYILYSSEPVGNQWWYSATQGGAGAPIPGATAQTYDATLTGTGYYWSIVTLGGCSSDTSNHKLVITTGIDPHPSAVINIYPVPNDGQFNVSISTPSEETYSISIYNNLGVKIYEETKIDVNGSIVKKIDLRPAPNGVYTVILESNQKMVIRKIVLNK